ncbi:MAG: hypothetical protein Q9220_005251 [cf. Caloplaca sp. 1 TL-2023]
MHHHGFTAAVLVATLVLLFLTSADWRDGNGNAPRGRVGIVQKGVVSKDVFAADAPRDVNIELGSVAKAAVPFGDAKGLQRVLDINLTQDYLDQGIAQGPRKVRKRADITWQKALDDGERMINLLRGDRLPNPWNDADQLIKNGWSTFNIGEDDLTDELDKPGGPFQALRIKQDGGRIIRVRQDKGFDNACYEDLHPTLGEYDQVYNIPSRTIIAIRSFSPLSNIGRQYPDAQQRLPFLNKWSDLTWIVWSAATNNQNNAQGIPVRDTLKYVFRNHIVTPRSMETMNAVFPRPGSNSDANMNTGFEQAWPGVTFPAGSIEFQALIGTPHGKGVVFLVVDHLQGRGIESVTMWTTTNWRREKHYELLYTLTGEELPEEATTSTAPFAAATERAAKL